MPRGLEQAVAVVICTSLLAIRASVGYAEDKRVCTTDERNHADNQLLAIAEDDEKGRS